MEFPTRRGRRSTAESQGEGGEATRGRAGRPSGRPPAGGGADDDGPGVFTTFVVSLDEQGRPADEELFDEAWQALRGALIGELRRRSLWLSSPAYLGLPGWSRWTAGAAEDPPKTGARGDAVEELLGECYAYIFLDRLRSLRAQLTVKPNIEGLVFRNLRNFLHERQKEHDPLGFRIFDALRGAVREAIADGELHVLTGSEKVRNDTVLAVSPDVSLPADDELVGVLDDLAREWNDQLLPELVTARGRAQTPVRRLLRRLLRGLAGEGVPAVTFKALVDPLKADARQRWGAILELEGEVELPEPDAEDQRAFVTMTRLLQPDRVVEERDAFRKLIACVSDLLDRLELAEPRDHLRTLWEFLRTFAGQEAARAAAGGFEIPDQLPSQRRLSELLDIPRGNFAILYARLGELVIECRRMLSGAAMRKNGPRTRRREGER